MKGVGPDCQASQKAAAPDAASNSGMIAFQMVSSVLVTTDHLSEGVDLHRWCRHLIHYELDPSPIRTIQRNGRIRRIDS